MNELITRIEIKKEADHIQDQLLTKLDWIDGAVWAVKRMTKFIRWYTGSDMEKLNSAFIRFKEFEKSKKDEK